MVWLVSDIYRIVINGNHTTNFVLYLTATYTVKNCLYLLTCVTISDFTFLFPQLKYYFLVSKCSNSVANHHLPNRKMTAR